MPRTLMKLDVINVYPTGENKGPKTYHGQKWALVSYETIHPQAKGVLDIPLPAECDNILAVAADALNKAIARGTFNETVAA